MANSSTHAGTTDQPPASNHNSPRDEGREQKLVEVWRSLSAPRRASALAWLAFLITWVITRAITIHGKGALQSW